jgi:hypothetical protein
MRLKKPSRYNRDTILIIVLAIVCAALCVVVAFAKSPLHPGHPPATPHPGVGTSPVLPVIPHPALPLPDPTASHTEYLVGRDIAPGVYHAPGGIDCAWEIARDLTPGERSIRDRHIRDGDVTATILATDVVFRTTACGQWTTGPWPATSAAN